MGIFITLSLCYLRHSKDRGINRGQGSSDLPTSEKIASTLPPQGGPLVRTCSHTPARWLSLGWARIVGRSEKPSFLALYGMMALLDNPVLCFMGKRECGVMFKASCEVKDVLPILTAHL